MKWMNQQMTFKHSNSFYGKKPHSVTTNTWLLPTNNLLNYWVILSQVQKQTCDHHQNFVGMMKRELTQIPVVITRSATLMCKSHLPLHENTSDITQQPGFWKLHLCFIIQTWVQSHSGMRCHLICPDMQGWLFNNKFCFGFRVFKHFFMANIIHKSLDLYCKQIHLNTIGVSEDSPVLYCQVATCW